MGFKKDVLWDIVNELGISASETYDVNSKDYDLVLIDGGVGQLNAAMAALDALGVEK